MARLTKGLVPLVALTLVQLSAVPAAVAQTQPDKTNGGISLVETPESTASSEAPGKPVSPKGENGKCVDIFALGVQGTGQSSLQTPRDQDGGFLGQLLGHVVKLEDGVDAEAVKQQFAREYISYDSGWGGFGGVGTMSYRDSVSGGIKRLEQRASEIVSECPNTKIVPIGYSQGADVTDHFLENVGNGHSKVPSSAIAAGFNMGAPARRAGQPIVEGGEIKANLPGKADKVAALPEITAAAPDGAGLTATGDHVGSYGDLTGRVVSFCEHGDLVCDMPADAPAARALAKVATSVTVAGDPFRALNQLGDALVLSPASAASKTINEDVHGTTLDSLSYKPSRSISQRLEDAAARDPEELSGSDDVGESTAVATTSESDQPGLSTSTEEPTGTESTSTSTSTSTSSFSSESSAGLGLGNLAGGMGSALGGGAGKSDQNLAEAGQALAKMGLIGVNALVAVARETFTPETIAQVASVGLMDPAASLPVLGAKVAASATKVLAPVGIRGAQSALQIAKEEVNDNQGLLKLATDVNYWLHFQKHTSYGMVPVDANGNSAMEYTRKFLIAATQDSMAASNDDASAAPSESTATSTATATVTDKPASTVTTAPEESTSTETTSTSTEKPTSAKTTVADESTSATSPSTA